MHAHGGAAVRRRLDEPLGLEHQQRLADGRAADAELARELLLLQPLPGLEPPVDDRLADQLRGGDARVADEPVALVAASRPPRRTYSMQSEPPRPSPDLRQMPAGIHVVAAKRWRLDRWIPVVSVARGPRCDRTAPSAAGRRSRRWSSSASARPRCARRSRGSSSSWRGRDRRGDVRADLRPRTSSSCRGLVPGRCRHPSRRRRGVARARRRRPGDRPRRGSRRRSRRLEAEIAASSRRQEAFERYLDGARRVAPVRPVRWRAC